MRTITSATKARYQNVHTERVIQLDLEGHTLEPAIEASQCVTLDHWQKPPKAREI